MRKLKILVATLAATLLLASPVFAQEADDVFALDIEAGLSARDTAVEVPGALDIHVGVLGGGND